MPRSIRYSIPFVVAVLFSLAVIALGYRLGHGQVVSGPPVDNPTAADVTLDGALWLWRNGQVGAALALMLHVVLPRLVLAWPVLSRFAPRLATRRGLALVSSIAAGVAAVVPLAATGRPVLLALGWQVLIAVALFLWPELRPMPPAPSEASGEVVAP